MTCQVHKRDEGEISKLAKEASNRGIAIELSMAGAVNIKSLNTCFEYAVKPNYNLIRSHLNAEDLAKGQNQFVYELMNFE